MKKLLKPEEVGGRLGVSMATLYSWSHKGINLKPRRIGRLLRYTEKDVEMFINKEGNYDKTEIGRIAYKELLKKNKQDASGKNSEVKKKWILQENGF